MGSVFFWSPCVLNAFRFGYRASVHCSMQLNTEEDVFEGDFAVCYFGIGKTLSFVYVVWVLVCECVYVTFHGCVRL